MFKVTRNGLKALLIGLLWSMVVAFGMGIINGLFSERVFSPSTISAVGIVVWIWIAIRYERKMKKQHKEGDFEK